MSAALSTVAKEEFDTEVKHAYQGMKTLRECVKTRNSVIGDKYDFRLMGKGVATQRTGSSADVVPMNVGHSLTVATLVDYEAPEYTDVYDQKTVNFDEVRELATSIAGAMGRPVMVRKFQTLQQSQQLHKSLTKLKHQSEDRYFVIIKERA